MKPNVIITGGSRGLGSKLAQAFWQSGANLILIGRYLETLEQRIIDLGKIPGQVSYILPVDLVNPHSPVSIINFAKSKFDKIDVLINNAAIQGPIGPSWENNPEDWRQTLQINLLAPAQLCNLFVQWMAPYRHGKIINLSGGGATGPRANFSAYATAKAALIRFSETLAEEVKPFNIDVNCVAPGAMDSTMTGAVLEAGPEKAGIREFELAQKTRRNQTGGLERAVDLITFLASSQSDGITGKLISAVWDPWETLPAHLEDLKNSDVYTLRRIVPKDRGMVWGER